MVRLITLAKKLWNNWKSSNKKDIRFTLRKINLPTNLGYGGGILEGLRKARGDFIGWTHADLQHLWMIFVNYFLW